jgi:glycolate oxidase
MSARYEEALKPIREVFGDRLKRGSVQEGEKAPDEALAFVSPINAKEVELLAEVAERFSVTLVGQGAGTGRGADVHKGSIVVRFDLMGGIRLPDLDEFWVEAEPGALLLELDNNLHTQGQGLTVYPTSAPRATIGGWLAQDGLGVGSFEYGWLSENVLSADVVLLKGGRRTIREDDLRSFMEVGESVGLVVGAKLRTRRADVDVPFAAHFKAPEDLAGAVADLSDAGTPLWHLAFVDPGMSRARGLGDDYLLFGAYPGERAKDVEEGLRDTLGPRGGRMLPAADAYRVWGERFFPVAPSHPTPAPERALVPLTELTGVLDGMQDRPEENVVQGTVSRSEEVLLLTFDAREEGWVR